MVKYKYMLSVGGCGVIWDGFTTVYGTASVLGGSYNAQIVSLLFAGLILLLLLNSSFIIKDGYKKPSGALMHLFLILALLYDFYTSYMGNKEFILGSNVNNLTQMILLLGITLFVTACPLGISFIWKAISDESQNIS